MHVSEDADNWFETRDGRYFRKQCRKLLVGVVIKEIVVADALPDRDEYGVAASKETKVGQAPQHVERVGKVLGYIERPSSETDVAFVGSVSLWEA